MKHRLSCWARAVAPPTVDARGRASRAGGWQLVCALALLLWLAAGGLPAARGAVIVNATADTQIRGGTSANTNFGSSSSLLIKGDDGSSLSFARKVYITFDISSLSGPQVESADLVLTNRGHDFHIFSPTFTSIDHALFGIIDNNDWSTSSLAEGSITWNNAPQNDTSSSIGFLNQGTTASDAVRELTTLSITGADAVGTEYRFSVTDYLRWALGVNSSFSNFAALDSDGEITFMLAWTFSIPGGGGASNFNSKEASVSLGPKLEVTLVPEPSSMALLAMGSLVLVGIGWRQTQQAAPKSPSAA